MECMNINDIVNKISNDLLQRLRNQNPSHSTSHSDSHSHSHSTSHNNDNHNDNVTASSIQNDNIKFHVNALFQHNIGASVNPSGAMKKRNRHDSVNDMVHTMTDNTNTIVHPFTDDKKTGMKLLNQSIIVELEKDTNTIHSKESHHQRHDNTPVSLANRLSSSTLGQAHAQTQNNNISSKSNGKSKKRRTAGSGWYDLPATELTPEIKRDFTILSNRSSLDPKHFYKRQLSKKHSRIPEFFSIGTVIEDKSEYYSNRLTRKQRYNTFTDELLHDRETQEYLQRKYHEIEKANTPVNPFKKFRKSNKHQSGSKKTRVMKKKKKKR